MDRRFHLCDQCGRKFSRRNNMMRHKEKMHSEVADIFPCNYCPKFFRSAHSLDIHRETHDTQTESFSQVQSAHRRVVEVFRRNVPENITTIDGSLSHVRRSISDLLMRERAEKKWFKAQISLRVRYLHDEPNRADSTPEQIDMSFNSHSFELSSGSGFAEGKKEVKKHIGIGFDRIRRVGDDFNERGSNWILDRALWIDVQLFQCKPLSAGHGGFHSVVYRKSTGAFRRVLKYNYQNGVENDHKCFFRAVARHFVSESTQNAIDGFVNTSMDISDIPVPVKVSDIDKFEKQNAHLNLAINVIYGDEDGDVYPVRTSPLIRTAENIITLAMYHFCVVSDEDECMSICDHDNSDKSDQLMHFAYVPDLGALLTRKEKERSSTRRQFFCPNCFSCLWSQKALNNHQDWCLQESAQRVEIPGPNEFTYFSLNRALRKFKKPFMIFFDFETLQSQEIDQCTCDTVAKCKHKTIAVNEQVPFAYSYVVLDKNNKLFDKYSYVGKDAEKHFANRILKLGRQLSKKIQTIVPMKLSAQQESEFEQTDVCHICSKVFDTNGKKVRDHCHISGKYLGAAHNICNMRRRESMKIPVFAHNFR